MFILIDKKNKCRRAFGSLLAIDQNHISIFDNMIQIGYRRVETMEFVYIIEHSGYKHEKDTWSVLIALALVILIATVHTISTKQELQKVKEECLK
jgi:hypothetical protein